MHHFSIFKRSKVSYNEFSKALRKLIADEYLIESEDKVKLSEKAKDYVLSFGSTLNQQDKHWRKVPEKMKTNLHSKFSFYVPSQKKLDKRTFNLASDIE